MGRNGHGPKWSWAEMVVGRNGHGGRNDPESSEVICALKKSSYLSRAITATIIGGY